MPKKTKSPKFWTTQNILILTIVVVLVGLGAFFELRNIRAADQANIVSIRELILLAVKGVKKEAPVDARTGDVYFPESKLYIPNPRLTLSLTYSLDSGDIADSHSSLTVSTYPVRGTEKLYTAQNSIQLFAAVPHLQACSRGVKLSYQQFPSGDTDNELKSTVTLNNGKKLYIYLEKKCPELSDLANTLKNVQAY